MPRDGREAKPRDGQRCPVCGSGKRCLTYPTGWVLCYGVESTRYKPNKLGDAWLHPPDAERPQPRWEPTPDLPERLPLCRLAVCNRFLLEQFTLTQHHRKRLREERGLSDQAIDHYRFRSIPEPAFADVIAQQVAERFPEEWQRIPGMARRAGRPRLVSGRSSGLLIPAKDLDGNIRGFRLRLDNPGDAGKYRWLSGGGGPSSGSHPSWWPAPVCQTELLLVEGEFKAATLAQYRGLPAIAVPGCQDLAGREVVSWLHRLRPNQIYLVLDPDSFWNRDVGIAIDRALARLSELPYPYEIEVYPW